MNANDSAFPSGTLDAEEGIGTFTQHHAWGFTKKEWIALQLFVKNLHMHEATDLGCIARVALESAIAAHVFVRTMAAHPSGEDVDAGDVVTTEELRRGAAGDPS